MAADEQQVPGLNLSTIPGKVAPSVVTIPSGQPRGLETPPTDMMVNLPGYTAEQRAETLKPPIDWETIGLKLEAFGAGIQGQEPLYLKLRRQQAVEQQQQAERKMKVDAFELEQQKRRDAVFQQGVTIAMDEKAPIETRIAALEGMSKQNPGIATLKPLITKQVLQDLPLAKDYLGDDVMQAIQGIQRNPNAPVDFPGGLTGIASEIKNSAEFGRAVVKEKGEGVREDRLTKLAMKGEQLGRADKQFLVDRDNARKKLDLEYKALGFQNRKLESDAIVAADTQQARAGIVQRPHTIQAQIGGNEVTLQEKVVGSGEYEVLTAGGQKVSGAKKPLVHVDIGEKSSEVAAKEYMKKAGETYQQYKTFPALIKNIAAAKELVAGAKGFMGTGGEALLTAAKFLNNRFGTRIDTEGVKNAEELRTRIFANILENLKKLDAQPSEMQQKIMHEALGSLGTDPSAMARVLDAYADSLRDKVSIYNAEVTSAESRGTRFPYDPVIKLPPADYSPKLDFNPPKSWGQMDDKRKRQWLQQEKHLTLDEAARYTATH